MVNEAWWEGHRKQKAGAGEFFGVYQTVAYTANHGHPFIEW